MNSYKIVRTMSSEKEEETIKRHILRLLNVKVIDQALASMALKGQHFRFKCI